MTLVVVDGNGYAGYVTSGDADAASHRPVRTDDLFQIGSISKSITALCVFKLVQEGRLLLEDDVRDHLRNLTIDTSERVTLQQLLNHTSGLPALTSLAPPPTGTLWVGFRPGSHWSYSDVAYDLLTKVVEAKRGATLDEVISREVFSPLHIPDARAAIRPADRGLYATGYYPERVDVPLPTTPVLVEAPFQPFFSGSGCIGMSAPQMAGYLRWLISAGRGRGGAILTDEWAAKWVQPTTDAPGWSKDAKYANGLAIVKVDGRTLLHHTGGMLGFVSSVHVDSQAGVASFASANTSWLTGYRPTDITSYACGVFRSAIVGGAAPKPEPVDIVVEKPADYAGVYRNVQGERIEFRPIGAGLELRFSGGVSALEPAGNEAFLARHPRFERYLFVFERHRERLTSVWWGPTEYATDTIKLRGPAPAPLAALAGRYDGAVSTTRIVARPTGLWLDGVTPLTQAADGTWRLGANDWSPERIVFDTAINGRPQRLLISGDISWRTADEA